jgi:hypothetical protein
VALKRFLGKCGLLTPDHHIYAIIRRIDIDADQRVSWEEFNEAITALELSSKFVPP